MNHAYLSTPNNPIYYHIKTKMKYHASDTFATHFTDVPNCQRTRPKSESPPRRRRSELLGRHLDASPSPSPYPDSAPGYASLYDCGGL